MTLVEGIERVPLTETIENTDAILSDILGTYPVVVVGPAAMDDEGAKVRLADRCRAIAKVCRTRGVPYLPVHAALKVLFTSLSVGSRLPAYSTALSRVLLAYASTDGLENYWHCAHRPLLLRGDQGEDRIASSRNAPELRSGGLTRMLP